MLIVDDLHNTLEDSIDPMLILGADRRPYLEERGIGR
jgi:hypothetical protein